MAIRVLRRIRELLDVDQATTPADADVIIWNDAAQEFTFGPPPGVGSGTPTGPAGGDLSGTYPNPQLDAGVVGTTELANSAVTSAKIADGTITTGDLAFDPATQAELDAEAAARAAADTAESTARASGDATQAANLAAHLADATDAHDASAVSIVDAGSFYTGTDVEAALQELGGSIGGGGPPSGPAGGVLSGTYPNPGFAADMATQAELDAHMGDPTDAHDASAISVDPTGQAFAGDDVQEVLGEIADSLAGHLTATDGAHEASAVAVTPAGGISSDDVQAALQELDTEKASAADLAAHLADTVDAHDASAISSVAAGTLASTDVQAALNELDSEKVPTTRTITAGSGLSGGGTLAADRTLDVNVDGSTLEINADTLRVKAGGIGANEIAADAVGSSELADNAVDTNAIQANAVTAAKVAADVATQAELDAHEADTTNVHGITDTSALYRSGGTDVALADGGTGASLADPNADRILFWDDSLGAVTWLQAGTGLTITGTTLDASGGSPSGAAGGALDGSYPNPGLAASVAGAGLAESADVLSVNVDGSTIEINSDTLRIKDAGVTAAKLATGPAGSVHLFNYLTAR